MQGTEHDIAFSLALGCAIALHCIALHCIALHCIALHCIVPTVGAMSGALESSFIYFIYGLPPLPPTSFIYGLPPLPPKPLNFAVIFPSLLGGNYGQFFFLTFFLSMRKSNEGLRPSWFLSILDQVWLKNRWKINAMWAWIFHRLKKKALGINLQGGQKTSKKKIGRNFPLAKRGKLQRILRVSAAEAVAHR